MSTKAEASAAIAGRPLVQSVRSALPNVLKELVPVWLSVEPKNNRRVMRRTGPGTFEISIEAFKGWRSTGVLQQFVMESKSAASLAKLIEQEQPELLSHMGLPGQVALIDWADLLTQWCIVCGKKADDGASIDGAVAQLVAELDVVLASRTVQHETLTLIGGLRLPEGIDSINLGNGMELRSLTDEQVTELASYDIELPPHHPLSPHDFSVGLFRRISANFSLSPSHEAQFDLAALGDAQEAVADVLIALHVAAHGRAGNLGTFTSYSPPVLPPLAEKGRSGPLVINSLGTMVLDKDGVDLFRKTYVALAPAKSIVKIAASRLADAEGRLSPVDALLDSVIGLEVLFNPLENQEISIRIALNYAHIGKPEDRRKRYEKMRMIMAMRNKVVHGGLNMKSPDAAQLHEQASAAKIALREAVNDFLFDARLNSPGKMTAGFWLDLLLPHTDKPDIKA